MHKNRKRGLLKILKTKILVFLVFELVFETPKKGVQSMGVVVDIWLSNFRAARDTYRKCYRRKHKEFHSALKFKSTKDK